MLAGERRQWEDHAGPRASGGDERQGAATIGGTSRAQLHKEWKGVAIVGMGGVAGTK